MEAMRTANLDEKTEPQTIKNQKTEADKNAIDKWAQQWYQSSRTAMVYRTALTKPPNGKRHPTFQYEKTRRISRSEKDARYKRYYLFFPLTCSSSLSYSLVPFLSKCVAYPVSTTLYFYPLFGSSFWDNLYELEVRVHADADVQYVRVAWMESD